MSAVALITGGARSGKSAIAEDLIAGWAGRETITYVATALLDDTDDALADRIERHAQRRSASTASWSVVDAGADLAELLGSVRGPVLLDSLGPWVATWWDRPEAFGDALAAVAEALAVRDGDTVVVSDEVGMTLHAPSAVGRWFTDAVGTANATIAAIAEPVWLCVSGRILALEPAAPLVAAALRDRAQRWVEPTT